MAGLGAKVDIQYDSVMGDVTCSVLHISSSSVSSQNCYMSLILERFSISVCKNYPIHYESNNEIGNLHVAESDPSN